MHFDFTPKFCVHIVIAVTMLMALLRQITPYAIPNFATLPIDCYKRMAESFVRATLSGPVCRAKQW